MRNILITGGTGFIGQHLVRHLLDTDVTLNRRICIYSRDEWKQAQMRKRYRNDPRLRFFVGDVRDLPRLKVAMNGGVRMDLVVHTAALKRVEVGEYNPTEMVRTNIHGTENVIAAAVEKNVDSVVFLSSDKACEPLNCYGATKLVGEKLILSANETNGANGPKFAVARYGNVAGSTGSIIPLWQDATGHHVMTHPDATRFWITPSDAVAMIMYCAGRRDMTIPNLVAYRVDDLAQAMGIKNIAISGLKPGEKLHETMMSAHEADLFKVPDHPEAMGHNGQAITSEHAPRMTVADLQLQLKLLFPQRYP